MKRFGCLLITVAALGAVGCEWEPPRKVLRIADESVTRDEIACPDRLSESSEECMELRRLKMRRVLFDAMLERAVVTSGVSLSEDAESRVNQFVDSLRPTRERYASAAQCHALAALKEMGEDAEPDPECVIDERQVEQMTRTLSKRELRELADEAFIEEMANTQRENIRAELTLRKIYDSLEQDGRSDEEFWREVYDSLDPVFYDASLRMGPAEVMTGDPNGWRG